MNDLVFKVFKKAAYTFRGHHLNRFYTVRATLNFVLRILKPKSVIVDGNRFYLDKNDSMRLSILRLYEPLTVKHFQEAVKPGDIVLDIGAHIGYYTLMAAKRVGKKGKVFAFEPDKDNRTILNKNIRMNGYKNVIVVNKAVASSTKRVKFFLNPLSTGMHSIIDLGYGSKKSILIDTVSLDDFFGKNPSQISVIKMDIEGGEYGALEGMRRLLENVKQLTLFIEFSPYSIKRSKKSPRSFLNLLRYFNFKLYSIDESKKLLIPINVDKFLASCPMDRDWHVNLMAVK